MRGWIYPKILFSFPTISYGEGWLYRDITFSLMTIFGEGVSILWHYIFAPDNIWWGGDYIVILHFHSWHFPSIWHWGWKYFNIFNIQIWLCSDSRILSSIYIYSPHETGGLKWLYSSMIPSFLLKLCVSGGYFNGLYQQSVMNNICKKP